MGVVVVAGGAGTLGREVVRILAERGGTVRVLSRRPAPPELPQGIQWAEGDVVTGRGLAAALDGARAVVHSATTPSAGRGRRGADADLAGTARLLAATGNAGALHFLYVSIVGMEGLGIGYYRRKLAAEAMVAAARLPWSVLRITQFHPLIDQYFTMLSGPGRLPLLLPSGLLFQPIDPADAARDLVAALDGGAAGRLPDVGGPEVRESHDLARSWLAARDQHRRVWPLPLPGRTGRNLRAGVLTCPGRRRGTVTWEAWLAATGRGRAAAG